MGLPPSLRLRPIERWKDRLLDLHAGQCRELAAESTFVGREVVANLDVEAPARRAHDRLVDQGDGGACFEFAALPLAYRRVDMPEVIHTRPFYLDRGMHRGEEASVEGKHLC